MSQFPIIKDIAGLEVEFSQMNNRNRSTMIRRFTVIQSSFSKPGKAAEDMTKEEKEDQAIKDLTEMMNHKHYEEIRDIIFDVTSIKGSGNALVAMNGYSSCFEENTMLEAEIFSMAVGVYVGKSQAGENTASVDTKRTMMMTQL